MAYQSVERFGGKDGERLGLLLQPGEEFAVANESDLHGLGHASAFVAPGQNIDKGEIVDHRDGRLERPQHVLEAESIDAVFDPDAEIVLRQNGGRNAYVTDAAVRRRRDVADEVEHRAPADGDNKRMAVDAVRHQLALQTLDDLRFVLATLAARDDLDWPGQFDAVLVRSNVSSHPPWQVRHLAKSHPRR